MKLVTINNNAFVETRNASTVLFNANINYTRVVSTVPGYNQGKPQYEVQLTTTDPLQARAWKSVIANLKISEDSSKPTSYTLKRPGFRGRPNVVHSDGTWFTEEERATIGNGTLADVKLSHNVHPTSRIAYVTLEGLKVRQLQVYTPLTVLDDFDF